MQLRGDRPIRHGFSARDVQHGAHTGYHTGPCAGSGFPHLGISTEGTVWALGVARERLASTEEALGKLAEYPDLTWYPPLKGSFSPRNRQGLADTSPPVVLRRGDDVPFSIDGRPSYAAEHKRRVSKLTSIKNELERTITAYEDVLASWKPQGVVAAPAKVETVHMGMPRKNFRHGAWEGITCRRTLPGAVLRKTKDPAEVTCKRCRALLGLPPI
jgi:hypothetical protein